MNRRLLFLWALLLLAGAANTARADTTFSYAVTGNQQGTGGQDVWVIFTPGGNGEDVAIPPTGTDILAGFYTSETGWMPVPAEGYWSAQIALTDKASGETLTSDIHGSLYAYPYSPSVTLDPVTLTVGRNRYTLSTGLRLSEGQKGYPFTIHVTAQSLDAPRLAFATQPGPAPAKQPLRPQPVVTVLNPDGSTATGFSGAVTLAIRSGTGASGATLTGTTSVPAVNGVATFTDVGVSERGQGYVLTATTEGASAVDSAPFDVTLPLGPDPVISYRTTGEDFHSFDPPPNTHGFVSVKTGYSGNVAARAAGTSLYTLAHLEFEEGGAARYAFSGIWQMGLELTDETTGETVSTTLAGPFAMEGCCTYPLPPLTADLFPRTVVAGGRRYTIRGTGLSAPPHQGSQQQYLGGWVNYNPPEQPGLAYATQPGGNAGSLTLDPQPVVVMRKPDGTTDTSFNGPVTLIVTPGFDPSVSLSSTNYGQVTINAVAGVAAFTNLALTKEGSNVTLTAFSGANPGADSQAFSVGTGISFAEAIHALRIAGGLEAASPPDGPVTLTSAVSLARKAAGLD